MDRLETNSTNFRGIRYTKEYREMVCREFLKGDVSQSFLERKYKLGHGRIVRWMKRLGYIAKVPTMVLMSKGQESSQELLPTQQRIKELEKELENARLQAEAYRLMIEVAERELKIIIRKK
jgi:hypothetical protein